MEITKFEPGLVDTVVYQLHLDIEHTEYCPADDEGCYGPSEAIHDTAVRVLDIATPLIEAKYYEDLQKINELADHITNLVAQVVVKEATENIKKAKEDVKPIDQWNQLYKNAPLPEPPLEEPYAQDWPGGEDYPDYEDYYPSDC